ncbi:MAG: BamA/TamA family outer membrane protein [Alphaproteobacteria bacterium]|nr:BamA/TamA family outer membrane protein [Alphaproteobacteria bacterium]
MAPRFMYRPGSQFVRVARSVGFAVAVLMLGVLAARLALAQPEATDPAEPPPASTGDKPPEAPPGVAPERPEVVFSYEPALKLDVTDDDEKDQIESAVRSSSLMFTYVAEPLDSVGVLFTRARADRQRIGRALNALGYFGPRVTITVGSAGIDDMATEDAFAANPPAGKIPVGITVVPGALFTFGKITVVTTPGASNEALSLLPENASGLIEGEPARSAEVAAANARLVTRLREEGYALAAVVGRDAVADHQTSKLDVNFRVDPGPKAKFGTVSIKGNETVETDFLAGLVTFQQGEEFDVETLNDYRTELERLSVFNSVAIEEAKSLDPQGGLPITVVLNERKLHVVGVSASYSTLEGAALGGYWMHRNLWGQAEQLRIDATSSRLFSNGVKDYEYGLSAALTKPAFPTTRDDLVLTLAAKRERPDAFERDAVLFDTRIRRRFDKIVRGEVGITIVQAHELDALGERDRSTIQLPVALAYDSRDNILDATKGLRASAGVQPIINLTQGNGIATRFDAAASTYWRLEENGETVLATRVLVGSSIAADITDLPVDLRYFAGGGGSVRGYEFQALSPRNAINQIIGGRSVAEGSVELRSWLWDDIGVAAFVDAGSASSANFPDFEDVGVGVGIGARYRTPVGPIRVDIAVPLDPPEGDSEFGIYVALGQAF